MAVDTNGNLFQLMGEAYSPIGFSKAYVVSDWLKWQEKIPFKDKGKNLLTL